MGSFVSRRKASVVRRSISVIFSFFIACKSSELPRIPYPDTTKPPATRSVVGGFVRYNYIGRGLFVQLFGSTLELSDEGGIRHQRSQCRLSLRLVDEEALELHSAQEGSLSLFVT